MARKPSPKITNAMRRALLRLHEGSSAILTGKGILCAGEYLPFLPATFLRLSGIGMVVMEGNRLLCTQAGREYCLANPRSLADLDPDDGLIIADWP